MYKKIAFPLFLATLCIQCCSILPEPVSSSTNNIRVYNVIHSDSNIAITNVRNYCDAREHFSLDKSTDIRITCNGEMLIGALNAKRDVFELYLDLTGERKMTYNSAYNKFFYFSEIDGSSEHTTVAFDSISPTRYNIEIFLPATLLGQPLKAGRRLGFDCALSDNDNGFEQEKQVAWHSINSDIWLDPRLWGILTLEGRPPHNVNDSLATALFNQVPPIIDGKRDVCWLSAPALHTDKILYGRVENTRLHTDIASTVRSLWSDKGLYFFVEVTDNNVVKQSYQGRIFDYGWIEDDQHNVVWKMTREGIRHAGGAKKNVMVDTVLTLGPGNYYLAYKSDESHAFEQWDAPAPDDTTYGIKLKFLRRSTVL